MKDVRPQKLWVQTHAQRAQSLDARQSQADRIRNRNPTHRSGWTGGCSSVRGTHFFCPIFSARQQMLPQDKIRLRYASRFSASMIRRQIRPRTSDVVKTGVGICNPEFVRTRQGATRNQIGALKKTEAGETNFKRLRQVVGCDRHVEVSARSRGPRFPLKTVPVTQG